MISLDCQFLSLFFKALSLSLRGSGGLEVLEKAQNSIQACLRPSLPAPPVPAHLSYCLHPHYKSCFEQGYSGTWRRQLCEEFPFLCNTLFSQQCTLCSLQRSTLALAINLFLFPFF